MNASAHVKSIDALARFRTAFCLFGEEVGVALSTIRAELDRFQDWLTHDQLVHWKHEIRVRDDQVVEAKNDLHRCLSATIDPSRAPSCHQQKKALERAKHRLEEAREKLAAVRRWIPIVERAVLEYRMKAEPLDTMLGSDLPRGLAQLDRSSAQLWAYINLPVPEAMGETAPASAVSRPPAPATEAQDDEAETYRPGAAKQPPRAAEPEPADAHPEATP